MTTTTATAPTYYRTRAGDHRHQLWACANSRRSLYGEVRTCTAAEAAELAPCTVCATGDEAVLAARVEADRTAAAAAKAATQCANTGVVHKGRIQSECRDCGKRGTVTNGRLRAHKPAPPAAPVDLY